MNKKNALPILIVNSLILIFSVWVLVSRYQKVTKKEPAAAARIEKIAPEKSESPAETETPVKEQFAAAVKPKKLRNILFQYKSSKAKAVAVIGDFNDWTPEPLKKSAANTFQTALKLRPGKYLYNYLVDGHVITDPNNRKPPAQSARGFKSSVLELKEINSR